MKFVGRIFQNITGIPMELIVLHCFLAWFWYLYEAEVIQDLMKADKTCLAQQFNFKFEYVDGVLFLNNSKFSEYLQFIYPRELEI